MRLYLLAPLVLALAACAAPETAPVQVASAAPTDPSAPTMECHQEAAIGSMMMHKVCTKPQTEAERNATQEAIRQNLPNNSIAHPAAGSLSH